LFVIVNHNNILYFFNQFLDSAFYSGKKILDAQHKAADVGAYKRQEGGESNIRYGEFPLYQDIDQAAPPDAAQRASYRLELQFAVINLHFSFPVDQASHSLPYVGHNA